MSKRKACHNASFTGLFVNEANMAYSSMLYVRIALKKNGTTLSVQKYRSEMSMLVKPKNSMSHIRHYRVLSMEQEQRIGEQCS